MGYGKELQEFLLENVEIKEIIDNSAKRSFANADVNTVITLFGPPQEKFKRRDGLNIIKNTANFTVFKKPFADIINTKTLLEIDEVKNNDNGNNGKNITTEGVTFDVLRSEDYRIVGIKQKDLKELGWERGAKPERKLDLYDFSNGKYRGDKWG